MKQHVALLIIGLLFLGGMIYMDYAKESEQQEQQRQQVEDNRVNRPSPADMNGLTSKYTQIGQQIKRNKVLNYSNDKPL